MTASSGRPKRVWSVDNLDNIDRCRVAIHCVVVRYRCHVVLISVRRLVLGFLRPVLDVLDRLRQWTVQRLWQEEDQKTASDSQSAEQNTRQPRYHATLFPRQQP